MAEVLYPSGYGTMERTLDGLMDRHCPVGVTEPEFRRRLRHFLQSKGGLIGIGDVLPRGVSGVSSASAAGRSFHQLQTFSDGSRWAAAVDLVVRRPGSTHSSGAVPWSEVPIQGTKYAAEWGVHINIPGEPWHIQCVEMDGYLTWVNRGRNRPLAGFKLPCTEPAPPPIVFDPRAGRFGLWPIKSDKPRLAVQSYVEARRRLADNRWRWTGDGVRYLQGVILHKGGGRIVVDGSYGPQTEGRVRDLQRQFDYVVDGRVGPQTWGAVDFLAGR